MIAQNYELHSRRGSGIVEPVAGRRLPVEVRAAAGVFEADVVGGVLGVELVIGGEQFDAHPLAAGEPDRFVQQGVVDVGLAFELCDVDRPFAGVEADEADDFVVALGDAHRPVVDEVPHHVPGSVRERGEPPGVGLDGVAEFHTPALGWLVIRAGGFCRSRRLIGDAARNHLYARRSGRT